MDPVVRWGRSVLEPDRAHVREPATHVVGGESVGFAICGAWLVADLSVDEARARCSTCLTILADPPP